MIQIYFMAFITQQMNIFEENLIASINYSNFFRYLLWNDSKSFSMTSSA